MKRLRGVSTGVGGSARVVVLVSGGDSTPGGLGW